MAVLPTIPTSVALEMLRKAEMKRDRQKKTLDMSEKEVEAIKAMLPKERA